MNRTLYLLAATSLLLLGCSQRKVIYTDEQAALPKALQTENNGASTYLKSRGANLVDELYEELLQKDKNLQQIAQQLDQLKQEAVDSTQQYTAYNSRNTAYYSGAQYNLQQVADTLLRQRVLQLLQKSQGYYELRTKKHKQLLDSLRLAAATAADLQVILKVTQTLPLIEAYQDKMLPSPQPMDTVRRKYRALIGNMAGKAGL